MNKYKYHEHEKIHVDLFFHIHVDVWKKNDIIIRMKIVNRKGGGYYEKSEVVVFENEENYLRVNVFRIVQRKTMR